MAGRRGICSCDCRGEVSWVKGQQNQVLGYFFWTCPYVVFSGVSVLISFYRRDTSYTEGGTTPTTSVYLNSLLTGPVDVIVMLYLWYCICLLNWLRLENILPFLKNVFLHVYVLVSECLYVYHMCAGMHRSQKRHQKSPSQSFRQL